ncbi:MAG: ATP-binding cassette domain-containing protein [Actinomycetota bacterium]|nr:ATP-binding cassette domain-containing protein [Actinomycetota bacterium]
MIRFDDFSFWYPESTGPAVRSVDIAVEEGEFALLVGGTGSGKSTLLRAVNGLVPHFTGGHVEGRVTTARRDSRSHRPREFAAVGGFVGQNPLAGFVSDTVEEELAYGMEQLAVPPSTMRRRVEDILDLMGIASLRKRSLRTLSGGEQQRVAIASVLTCAPRVLVLDEPTSALDPGAAEDILAAILRLVHDLGVTVLAAEHRLERVVEYADQVILVERARVRSGPAMSLLQDSPLAPPVVELGRLAGWKPLPLSVRDARRAATALREQLRDFAPEPSPDGLSSQAAEKGPGSGLSATGIEVRYGGKAAVSGVSITLAAGQVVALMGRNGSGKSSLLWALCGAGTRSAGDVRVDGRDPSRMTRRQAAALVTLVPQQAADLLYHPTVARECAAADQVAGIPEGTARETFERLLGTPVVDWSRHPRDLSEGQRLALVLALQLSTGPGVILLDEPTRGLDYHAKDRLRQILATLAAEGCAVLVATHDVEFVAAAAHRVVVMAQGKVITDATTSEVLPASPVFAPQVAKVLAPEPWLTVDQVAATLNGLAS